MFVRAGNQAAACRTAACRRSTESTIPGETGPRVPADSPAFGDFGIGHDRLEHTAPLALELSLQALLFLPLFLFLGDANQLALSLILGLLGQPFDFRTLALLFRFAPFVG